jgi:hypothetical protein
VLGQAHGILMTTVNGWFASSQLSAAFFASKRSTSNDLRLNSMLGIFFILLIMWGLGMISSYTFGGAIHLLLVFALIVLVIRLAQGRSVV